MTATGIIHGMFTVEHNFRAPPARVFRAWTSPEEMRLWAAPAEGWDFTVERFDFRPGGTAVLRFGPKGEEPFQDLTRFDDIRGQDRIVTAYAISRGDLRISSSVSSVEFLADGGGTRLRITESGAYLDGHDSPRIREGGVQQQVAQLAALLGRG